MHTEALPRQFKIVAEKEEMTLLIAVLGYAAGSTNTLWAAETKEKVLRLRVALENTLKQS